MLAGLGLAGGMLQAVVTRLGNALEPPAIHLARGTLVHRALERQGQKREPGGGQPGALA